MTLQHLGLNVRDPAAFAAFLSDHFGMRQIVRAGRITMLEDERGFVLALAAASSPPSYPPDFHLGFYVTGEDLRETYDRLIRNGFYPTSIEETHGRLKFFVEAPESILIEVAER